ncbi:DUF4468 domain-containing protein [Odoribacter lunatus]|uniref:DUF4468 domain-containing protein n=1 Tax=Odoribacter lunatus TaxID=2941335 RepID=UPI0020425E5C|nr:DUF4468 domain-containing protein [Odoribacter lunatus]
MKSLLFILLCIPSLLWAQDEEKYLKGAVPEVNGKVTFTKTIEVPGLSQEQLFHLVQNWAQQYFTEKDEFHSRILYSDASTGKLASLGEEYLVFTDKALSLDRSKISYQMFFDITNGKCEAKITAIRYLYEEQNSSAESTITDEVALYKNKNKLIRQPGKFRIHTIDLVDRLFSDLQKAITPQAHIPATSTISTHPANSNILATIPTSSTAPSTLQGFKQISPEQIPGNIIRLLSQDWMLITAGNTEDFNTMTASWGGLGHLYNKPVTFCFINPTRYTYQFMEKEGTYTLSFYTEAYRDALKYCGSHSGKDTDKIKESGLSPIITPNGTPAFSEAWLIIECRKLVSQSFIPEALHDKILRNQWTGKSMHKMYIGEILNVWVK